MAVRNPIRPATGAEILDLRHFTSEDLRPLLDQEVERWGKTLAWDYRGSSEMILRYVDAKILPGSSQFDLFLRGFNKSHPLCDFVDAGNDKEAADGKIKGKRKFVPGSFGQLTGEFRNAEAIFSECPLQAHSFWWVGRQ